MWNIRKGVTDSIIRNGLICGVIFLFCAAYGECVLCLFQCIVLFGCIVCQRSVYVKQDYQNIRSQWLHICRNQSWTMQLSNKNLSSTKLTDRHTRNDMYYAKTRNNQWRVKRKNERCNTIKWWIFICIIVFELVYWD